MPTVSHVFLPHVVCSVITKNFDELLYLILAATLNKAMVQNSLNLPFRFIINDLWRWRRVNANGHVPKIALQQRNMKDILNLFRNRQLKSISYLANALKILEGTSVSRCKFVSSRNLELQARR